MAKRRGTPWGPSNPLYRWMHRKGKVNKRRSVKSTPVTRMATRRRRRYFPRRRRSRKQTIPLAPVIGLVAGMAEPIQMGIMKGNWKETVDRLSINYMGYDPKTKSFHAPNLMQGLGPLVIGCLVHKFVGGAPLNVNRALAQANVPYIRI